MASNVITLIMEGEDRGATKVLKKTETQTEKTAKKIAKFSKDMVKSTLAVAAAFAGIGIAAKKAFEFAEQGAVITQTAESFDLLLDKVGAMPGLLGKLDAASGGTITKMSLMSSTATLLAGTAGDMATELANATPRLLEIAKAANKLNPALGTTTFMYESLARGIKRSSPLILDNLGIIISVAEANEKYAESLGISTEALTKEQQQIALLNEVLGKGDTLINQVGGSVDAVTDSYSKLRREITEFKNLTKQDVFKAFGTSVEDIGDAMERNRKFAELWNEAIELGLATSKEANTVRAEMGRGLISEADALEKAVILLKDYEFGISAAIDPSDLLAEKFDMLAASAKDTFEEVVKLGRIKIGFDFEMATTGGEAQSFIDGVIENLSFSLNADAVKVKEDSELVAKLIGDGTIPPGLGLAVMEELAAEMKGALSEGGLADDIFAGLTGAQFGELSGEIVDKIDDPLKQTLATLSGDKGVIPSMELLNIINLLPAAGKIQTGLVTPIAAGLSKAQTLESVLSNFNDTEYTITIDVVVNDPAGALDIITPVD